MRFTQFALAALLVVAASQVQAQVVLTIDAPGVQSSQVANITTETFDGFAAGQYTTLHSVLGTYTSAGQAIVVANQYGGAGGTGNYLAIGAQSGHLSTTLTLNGEKDYFGFWYSAADALNSLQLYQGNTLEYTLNTPALLSLISSQPNSNAYFGNPNNGEDSGEAFVYVNLFGTNGTVFDKVVFNNASTGTGFESDNHSVRAAVPEPGSVALLVGMGFSGAGFLARRRKQTRQAA